MKLIIDYTNETIRGKFFYSGCRKLLNESMCLCEILDRVEVYTAQAVFSELNLSLIYSFVVESVNDAFSKIPHNK